MTRADSSCDEVYESLIGEAREAVRERDFISASHLARQALAHDPTRAAGYNILAIERELQGDRLEALDLLRAGLAVEPTYISPRTGEPCQPPVSSPSGRDPAW